MNAKRTVTRLVFGLTVLAGTLLAALVAQPSFVPDLHTPALHGAVNPQPLPPEGRS